MHDEEASQSKPPQRERDSLFRGAVQEGSHKAVPTRGIKQAHHETEPPDTHRGNSQPVFLSCLSALSHLIPFYCIISCNEMSRHHLQTHLLYCSFSTTTDTQYRLRKQNNSNYIYTREYLLGMRPNRSSDSARHRALHALILHLQ